MSSSGFHEVEALFDTLDTRVKAINPAVDARQTLFDVRHPHLHVLQIIANAIHALFDPGQTRLDLLQNGKNDVGDFAHDWNVVVLPMFCKLERLK